MVPSKSHVPFKKMIIIVFPLFPKLLECPHNLDFSTPTHPDPLLNVHLLSQLFFS